MEIFTLDEALEEVARRSFYDDCTVTPAIMARTHEIVGYTVSDDTGLDLPYEWTWTPAGGITDHGAASEVSRLHDPAERYDDPAHIRFNLPDSVAALESGTPVSFAYAPVHALDPEDPEDPEDGIVGWLLASIFN